MSWSDWFEFLKVVGSVVGLAFIFMLIAGWMLDRSEK